MAGAGDARQQPGGRFAAAAATARGAALAVLALACATVANACPAAIEVRPADLYGLWRATIEGAPAVTLLLEKHPEYTDALSGGVNRDGEKGVISAEVENGEFTMEESLDGTHIFATWVGSLVEGSCGREIRGSWQRDDSATAHGFVLRKL